MTEAILWYIYIYIERKREREREKERERSVFISAKVLVHIDVT